MSGGDLLLEAYPLTWPDRQPRTRADLRREARFQVTLGQARDELLAELGRMRTRHVVISSNVPVRRDGLPYADAREPADPGVAVYFERSSDPGLGIPRRWSPFVIACDSYTKLKWNLRAVGRDGRGAPRDRAARLLGDARAGLHRLRRAPAGPMSASSRPRIATSRHVGIPTAPMGTPGGWLRSTRRRRGRGGSSSAWPRAPRRLRGMEGAMKSTRSSRPASESEAPKNDMERAFEGLGLQVGRACYADPRFFRLVQRGFLRAQQEHLAGRKPDDGKQAGLLEAGAAVASTLGVAFEPPATPNRAGKRTRKRPRRARR